LAERGDLEGVQFGLETGALGGAVVRIVGFDVTEALDEPYLADVELAIEDPDADPLALLGVDCALLIDRIPLSRRICGVVRTVWEGEASDLGVVRARVEIVPALWMLSLRRNTRIFQEKTVPEILEAVLAEALGAYGRSVELELSATYARREYCTQYQETDLAFVSRLMAEEGISYSFDHKGAVEVLILRDANTAYARVESATDTIELHAHDLHARDREAVHAFERRHRHTTTSVVVRDFDWSTPGFLVEDEERGQDAQGRDRESYEHGLGRSVTLWDYTQAAKRYQQRNAPQQKTTRREAHVEPGLIGTGVGGVIGFTPGMTFELTGHETVGLDGEYLLTRVHHVSRPAGRLGGLAEPYQNRFECIPLEVPHRPTRRALKPHVPGIQTAIVTGPSGEEIHTDEHGRIKVRFHWDRESPADETSSCWVRCEQAWAGAGWGMWWIPRIGMEVVVHFVDGDPDRPLVTGCVYDGANATPYPLPDEKTKSTIKSNSSPGGGGSNELRFEDKAGSEEIYAHAQKDYNEVVENDHNTLVHHDQTNEVDGNQTQTVHGNQTERVDANQTLSVGGDRTVHVEGNFDETVDGTETRNVTGDVTETFSANETRSIAADVTEDIAAGETRTIGGNQTEDVGASHTLSVSGSDSLTVSGSLSLSVTGGITQTTPATCDITATGGFSIDAAAGVTWVAAGGVKILAPGGTTMIDPWNDWSGAEFASVDATSESLVAFKLEMGGGILEACGDKVEIYPVFINADGFSKKEWGAILKNAAAKVEGSGIKSWTDVLHHEG
jgi:type VI secretion system secreted protein VgrG